MSRNKMILLMCGICIFSLMITLLSCQTIVPPDEHESDFVTEIPMETENQETEESQNPEDIYVPVFPVSEEEREILYNANNYNSEMNTINFADEPVIKTKLDYWWLYGSMEECLEAQRGAFRYMFMGDEAYEVLIETDGMVSLVDEYALSDPFIKDLQSSGSNAMVSDKLCYVYEVICINGCADPIYLEGIINWFVTDQGVYVKYYEDAKAEGVVFEVEEFERYRKAYYAFRRDPAVSEKMGVEPFTEILNSKELFEKYSQETTAE